MRSNGTGKTGYFSAAPTAGGEAVKSFPRSALRHALPVALVAFVVFQSLRLHVADRYLVPSDSMQPTLFGDQSTGDVVLVDKISHLWRAPPGLNELVVVRDPEDPARHLVKRVAATEHQWVRLDEGDLWLGPDRQHVVRVVKQPLGDADLRIPWLRWPGIAAGEDLRQDLEGPWREADGELILPPAADTPADWLELLGREAREERGRARPPSYRLPGLLATSRAVDATYLDLEDRRGGLQGAGQAVRDAGMVLEVRPSSGLTGLLLVMQHHPDDVSWSYHADGTVELLRQGVPTGWSARAPRLDRDGRRRIEFGFLDQHDFLAVDGVLVGHVERLAQEGGATTSPGWPNAPRNLLMVGAAGGPLAITGLTVFRDIYYWDRKPFGDPAEAVGAGQVYLLGDNSFSSRDSRTRGPFSLSELVGRPVLVLSPGSRRRWLSR